MNVRKLMARLNVPTIHYDTVRGGAPELTPQDLAGAVGMVDDTFARDVFCAIWWPDGSALKLDDLIGRIRTALLAEYARRCRIAEVAKLELHCAECEWEARRIHSEADRQVLSRAKTAVERAKADAWPGQPRMYAVIAQAVLVELQAPDLCTACSGRGDLKTGGVVRTCPACEGRAIAAASDRRRAGRIGRDESTYRGTWRPVYEWAYTLLSDAEASAARKCATGLDRQAA